MQSVLKEESSIVACTDTMRLCFWNKRQKTDLLLMQLASYKSVLAKKLLLSLFTVQEILEFDNSVWKAHLCRRNIHEFSFSRLWGLNREIWLCWFDRFQLRTFRPWLQRFRKIGHSSSGFFEGVVASLYFPFLFRTVNWGKCAQHTATTFFFGENSEKPQTQDERDWDGGTRCGKELIRAHDVIDVY